MDLLVACHCDKVHKPLYYTRGNNNFVLLNETSDIKSIEYVDINQGCKNWSDISNDSIDVIWTQKCPLGEMLTKNPNDEKTFKNMLDDLFIKGYEILRKDGCIYYVISEKHINNILIPIMNPNYLTTLMSYETYYNNLGFNWKFITMKAKDLDFYIDENKYINDNDLVIKMIKSDQPIKRKLRVTQSKSKKIKLGGKKKRKTSKKRKNKLRR